MTAAVRDTISTPRATVSVAVKASLIFTREAATRAITAACTTVIPVTVVRGILPSITMEPVMHVGLGIRNSRQVMASAARKVIRIIITASATSAVRPACTTVIPAPVVRGILPSITMEPAIHAVRGLDYIRQAKASAVPKVIRIIITANAMHRQSPRALVPM